MSTKDAVPRALGTVSGGRPRPLQPLSSPMWEGPVTSHSQLSCPADPTPPPQRLCKGVTVRHEVSVGCLKLKIPKWYIACDSSAKDGISGP